MGEPCDFRMSLALYTSRAGLMVCRARYEQDVQRNIYRVQVDGRAALNKIFQKVNC